MDIYYQTARSILRFYQTVLAQDCRVSGEPDVAPGPKIIAANHPNATDSFHIPFVFPEKLHFLIQGDIFDLPFFGWLLAKNGQIPVWPDRKKEALDQACAWLKQGETVVIYPEGRLNPDYEPLAAKAGAVLMSLMTGAPILPVGFYVPAGHVRPMVIWRGGRWRHGCWQMGGHCYLQIGSRWLPRQEVTGRLNSAIVQSLAARLMAKIDGLVQLAALECARENQFSILRSQYHDS